MKTTRERFNLTGRPSFELAYVIGIPITEAAANFEARRGEAMRCDAILTNQ